MVDPSSKPPKAAHQPDQQPGQQPGQSASRRTSMADDAVHTTALALPGRRQGKVRDLYSLPGGPGTPILMIATDRISAFDVVMPTPVPGKGRLLTAMSLRWFSFIRGLHAVDDHLLSDRVEDVPDLDDDERRLLRGRIMVCRPARVVPIECVARGHLAGSGWQEYRRLGTVCGVELPPGLVEGDQLPEPIFTPATKADEGHDENITIDEAAARVGGDLMHRLRELTLQVYNAAYAYAARRGILLADTKFEFGHAIDPTGEVTDQLLLIDEVLTSDSSRFWPREQWSPGREQPSFDKQFLRDWLLEQERQGAWNRQPPGPEIPETIVSATLDRYREAYERLWSDGAS